MKPIEQFLNLCSINWRLKGQLPRQAFSALKMMHVKKKKSLHVLYLFVLCGKCSTAVFKGLSLLLYCLQITRGSPDPWSPLLTVRWCWRKELKWWEKDLWELILRPELPGPLNYRWLLTFSKPVARCSPSLQKEALRRMVRVNICYGKITF